MKNTYGVVSLIEYIFVFIVERSGPSVRNNPASNVWSVLVLIYLNPKRFTNNPIKTYLEWEKWKKYRLKNWSKQELKGLQILFVYLFFILFDTVKKVKIMSRAQSWIYISNWSGFFFNKKIIATNEIINLFLMHFQPNTSRCKKGWR